MALLAAVSAVSCGEAAGPTTLAQPSPSVLDASPTASVSAVATATTAVRTPEPTPRTYIVRTGDTLNRIAFRFGLTREELLAWNPQLVDPDRIRIGDRLTIPQPGAIPPVPSAAPGSSLPPLSGWREWVSQEALFRVRLPPRWVAVTWEVARDSEALASLGRQYRRFRASIEDWARRIRQSESPQIIEGLRGGDPDASPRYEVRIAYVLAALDGVPFERYIAGETAAAAELVEGGRATTETIPLPPATATVITVLPTATTAPEDGPTGVVSYHVPVAQDVYVVRFSTFGGLPNRSVTDAIAGTFRPAPTMP